MARSATLCGIALLGGFVAAQKPIGTEVHPRITTFRCTLAGGCKEKTNYIVLDSLAHPVYQQANGHHCGSWGERANATACPTKEACAENCVMEGLQDYSVVGVSTSGASLRLQQLRNGQVVSPRVYLLDGTENKYEMLQLTGNEFTFDVIMNKLPCGMNSALYLSEMLADGGKSELNKGGAHWGTGYCDAYCAWNPYRIKQPYYYGNNNSFKVDTSKPMTVVTQFPTNKAGKLAEIRRLYVQDGVVIQADAVKVEGLPAINAMNDEFCRLTGSRRFMDLGAHEGMGDALARGMVLAMSIWWDEGGHMQWLDGAADGAGPCNATEGAPRNIRLVEPNPEVTFSNIKWGEIGSTFKGRGHCSRRRHVRA
ncbi:hypothetical protein MAPG_01325 [Magnaporthiopsis poae ATCC 64411]|uniref:Glucanase n=1 Tax=Magnaporthiopsis poae (strain ATCC 64411 / 73-15) TaxID=644358 RepID=A0A0C4DNE4_MAGP6|nr:hypothetical protein MAPG_01325 [Magnaporthiopsis poae ATCC 64411]